MNGASDVVTALASARRGTQLYPPEHPAYGESLETLVSAVGQATTSGRPLVLNWYQGHLYHESTVVSAETVGASAIAEAFEDRRIESLTFLPTFGPQDASGLAQVLAMRFGPDLDIKTELEGRGAAGVVIASLADESDPEREEHERQRQSDRALYLRTLVALRRLHERFANGGPTDLSDTSKMVNRVLSRVLADPPAALALATIQDAAEHRLLHSINVMIYALVLGRRLGLPEEGLASLGMSALLHDIGKSAFDGEAVSDTAPVEALHPEAGARILQRVAIEDPAPMLVAHEHHMGVRDSGWPTRPAGYVTHPFSRMVAVANRYENLVNPAPGSTPLTPDRAIFQVLHEGDAWLEPFFVRLFASALGVFPVGSLVRLSDQSVGVVAKPGAEPLKPVVRLAYDADGSELPDRPDLDLSECDVEILEVIEAEALDVTVSEKL